MDELNNPIINRRLSLGFSIQDVCMLTGIYEKRYIEIETLKIIPSKEHMTEISNAFNMPEEKLFPSSMYDVIFARKRKDYPKELDDEKIQFERYYYDLLLRKHSELMTEMNDIIFGRELQYTLSEILCTLDIREHQVLELLFGLMTGEEKSMEEVGLFYGMTGSRIYQIEQKALRKLRYFHRSRRLSHFLGYRNELPMWESYYRREKEDVEYRGTLPVSVKTHEECDMMHFREDVNQRFGDIEEQVKSLHKQKKRVKSLRKHTYYKASKTSDTVSLEDIRARLRLIKGE